MILRRETKTYATLLGPGPLPDGWAPVICTGFPSPISSALLVLIE